MRLFACSSAALCASWCCPCCYRTSRPLLSWRCWASCEEAAEIIGTSESSPNTHLALSISYCQRGSNPSYLFPDLICSAKCSLNWSTWSHRVWRDQLGQVRSISFGRLTKFSHPRQNGKRKLRATRFAHPPLRQAYIENNIKHNVMNDRE